MKQFILLSCALLLSLDMMATKKQKVKHKKTAAVTTPVKAVMTSPVNKANTMRLCTTPNPQPAWFLELPTHFEFPANFKQPANYRLVSTIDTVFNSFLNSIPYQKSTTKIMLPLFMNNTIECKEFIISRTETMDSVLQAEYPELKSFKAFAADNSLNTARIDCDGVNVKMMITYDHKVYFITSTPYNQTNYYICYAKDDPNFVKDKFEK